MNTIGNSTARDQIVIVLVGNKCDMENRDVTKEEGDNLAKEYGLKYFETSALNNFNVNTTFDFIANEIIELKGKATRNNIQSNETKPVNLQNDKGKGSGTSGKDKKCC